MRETLELYSEQKGSNILMFELNNNTLYGETNFEELQQHRVWCKWNEMLIYSLINKSVGYLLCEESPWLCGVSSLNSGSGNTELVCLVLVL